MKPVRFIAIALFVAICFAVIVAAVAMNARFQAWALRRALAGHPEWNGSVASFTAGFSKVSARGVRFERNGAVLEIPSLEADLAVAPAILEKRLGLERLVARGWTLDLTKGPPLQPRQMASAFKGVFADKRLPFNLSLGELELEGDVLLPHPNAGVRAPLKVHLVFVGGGLGAGKEGSFTFNVKSATAASIDEPVNAMAAEGTLGATMDGGDSFTRLDARVHAAASGPKFPDGVRLSADIVAAQGPFGESYTVALAGDTKELVTLRAEFARHTGHISGAWTLDHIRDDDLAPFAFGHPLPLFEVYGSGRFDSDATLAQAEISGQVDASADRLAVLRPEFSAIGAVGLTADFKLAKRGALYRVDRLRAVLSGAHPVLTVQALQAFAYNASTGELQVADAAGDLVGLTLQDVPLEWAQPLLPGYELAGSPVRGDLVAIAGHGGLALRSKAPLAISGLSVSRNGSALVRKLDVSLEFAGDYNPLGWQIEVSRCAARSAEAPLFTLSAKCGKLVGPNQTLKLAGHLDGDFPNLLIQPCVASWLRPGAPASVAAGTLACDFSAELAEPRSLKLKLALSNLALFTRPGAQAAGSGGSPEGRVAIPDLSTDAQVDIGADRRLSIVIPLVYRRDGVESDLKLQGAVFPDGKTWVVDGGLSSEKHFAPKDIAPLAAAFFGNPFNREAAAAEAGTRSAALESAAPDAVSAWNGLGGQVKVDLRNIEGAGSGVSRVSGTLRAEASSLQFDGFRLIFAAGGEAGVNGSLAFNRGAVRPYAFQADFSLSNLDAAPLFRPLESSAATPAIEGKFDVSGHVQSDGSDLLEMLDRVRGDCQATSRGGNFSLLSAHVVPKVESVGKLEAAVAYLGSVTSAITGRKETGDLASLPQAASAFAKFMSPVQYDQLNVTISRGESLDTVLKDFSLVAPEIRIGGSGRIAYHEGVALMNQPLSMHFTLRALGHQADILKYLGVLDPKHPDDLGYLACAMPIHVEGTLAKPDQSQFDAAIAKLSVERSGAGEALGKLLDKKEKE